MTSRMRALLAPVMRFLDAVEQRFDASETAQSAGARRFRQVVGMGVMLVAVVVGAWRAVGSGAISPFIVLMAFIGFAIYQNQVGRFLRDWSPVALMFLIYGIALELVEVISMPIWYAPQADTDRVIGLGNVPSVALQHWLDADNNQPLAVLSAFAYMSHFFVPVMFGFYVWYWRRGVGFNALMWTYITVSFMAAVVYVLFPAAPPWMAAERGDIPPVFDVIKDGLHLIGFDTLARLKGDTSALYLTAAAFPSIHAAFPTIGVIVARHYRMPRWVQGVMIAHLCVIWFTIVYTGEHYVIDIAGGVAFALGAWWIVQAVSARIAAPPAAVPEPLEAAPAGAGETRRAA
jgi:hypothetical protein